MFVQQTCLRSRLKCLEAALCGNRCRDGRVRRETSVLHCLRRPAQQLVLAMAKGEERGGGLTAEEFFESVLQRQRAAAGASALGVGEPRNGERAAEGVSEELRAEVQQKLQQQAVLAEREAAGGTLQREEADQGTSGQADPRQGYEERERARAERRQQGMQEYAALKQELERSTLGIAACTAAYCFLVLSAETAASYALGAVGSFLYLQLLYREADGVSADSVPEVFRQRRRYLQPSAKRGTGGTVLRVLEGSRRALSSPRLPVPAVLMGLWAASLHWAGDAPGAFHLELAPLLLGFLAYKGAALLKAFNDNRDLLP